eukprot:4312601-Prorocentrum_lima.AAC.1
MGCVGHNVLFAALEGASTALVAVREGALLQHCPIRGKFAGVSFVSDTKHKFGGLLIRARH